MLAWMATAKYSGSEVQVRDIPLMGRFRLLTAEISLSQSSPLKRTPGCWRIFEPARLAQDSRLEAAALIRHSLHGGAGGAPAQPKGSIVFKYDRLLANALRSEYRAKRILTI